MMGWLRKIKDWRMILPYCHQQLNTGCLSFVLVCERFRGDLNGAAHCSAGDFPITDSDQEQSYLLIAT